MFSYLHNILISIDQFINTLCYGNPDETVSSRLGKYQRRGSRIARFACAIIDVLDRDHCLEAIEEDEV